MRETITTMIPLIYVPIFSALAGFLPSFPLTHRIPITEAIIPTAERISGNKEPSRGGSSKLAPKSGVIVGTITAIVIAEIIEPT